MAKLVVEMSLSHIFVLEFLCSCFRLPFLAFLSDVPVPKYLLVIMSYLGSQKERYICDLTDGYIFCREMGKQPSG